MDDSLAFYGLRDPAACADFAASRVRTLIETGIPARDIGVMTGDDPQQLAVLPGEGTPDWEAILRGIQVAPPEVMAPDRNLEGISPWSAQESPWRACRHLTVTDFTDGLYPTRPRANPLFLDSEIAAIRRATGLHLQGQAEGLAHGLSLFDQQLQAVSGGVTFLLPWRDLASGRLQPAAGLSLVARVMADHYLPALARVA